MKFIKLLFVLATIWMICVLIGKELMREGLIMWDWFFMFIDWIGGANFLAIILIIIGTAPIWSTLILMFYLWTKTIEPQEDL